MKDIKRLISGFLVLIICISSLPIYAQGERYISSWFEKEFIGAQRYGIYDKKFDSMDLSREISLEDIEDILDKVDDKLIPVDKYINTDFKEVATGDKTSRGGFLKALYNIEGIYENELALAKDPIEHLISVGVLKGNGYNLYLDRKITREEAIIFSKRMVDHIYSKKSSGAKGLMWEVEKDGRKVYLLASLDLGDNYIYPLSKDILKRYEEADKFLVHVNTLDSSNHERDEIYYEDSSLKENISEELYAKVKEIMDAYEVEEEYYEDMKIWAVLLVISNLSLTGDGGELSNEHGVTKYLTELASKDNKEIVELEGLDYQYDLLDSLTKEQQIHLLDDLVKNILHEVIGEENNKEIEEKIVEAWRLGDKKQVQELLNTQKTIEDVNDVLLVERDKNMAKKISELLEGGEDKTYFISLHSEHLLFKGTILDSLRAMGYKVNQLK